MRHFSYLALIGALGAMTAMASAAAQADETRPSYKALRYDEDWRALCDPTKRTDWLDQVKCMPLALDTTLTFGGDLRARGEVFANPGFGLKRDSDQVLLFRSLLHGDLRMGDHVRVFTQFGFADQVGRAEGPSPTDVDRGDLMQGFIDVSGAAASGDLTLRGGRQEMSFGSSRLISVRDSPNIRRAFDGVRGFWKSEGYRADAFYVSPVDPRPGSFDDRTNGSEALGGVYLTGPVAAPVNADLYWFDYRRDNARFASGTADEWRQSIGTRLFGKAGGLDWDIEGVYQWGQFGARGIAAWTLASNVGYTFTNVASGLRLGIKADIASGDRSGGRSSLGTFNALYPKLPYFSEANLVAPANIIDLHPELTLSLTRDLKASFGWNVLWRETTKDAIYAPPLSPIANTAGKGGRYIGQQAIVGVDWQATEHIAVSAGYVHFAPGQTLRDVGGRAVDFGFGSIAYRF